MIRAVLVLVFSAGTLINNGFAQHRTFDKNNHLDQATYKKYEEKTRSLFLSSHFKPDLFSGITKDPSEQKKFKKYIHATLQSDRRELYIAVGENRITEKEGLEKFIAAKHEKYRLLYAEFLRFEQENPDADQEEAKTPFSPGRGPGQPCNNMDFETRNFNGWNGSYGSSQDPTATVGFNTGAINSTGSEHTIMTGGTDPVIPAISCVMPGGTSTLRLGDAAGGGLQSARISQTFMVNPSNPYFTYNYAVVVEDGNSAASPHTAATQPFFQIRMYLGTSNAGTPIDCASLDINGSSAASLGLSSNGTYYYKNWTQVLIPLNAYAGQNVTIQFTVSDCMGSTDINGNPYPGSHDAWAYLDCSCNPPQIVTSSPTICGGTTVNVSAPSGLASYSWTGPGIVGATNTQTITANQAGNYTVTMQTVTTPPNIPCTFSLDTLIPGNPASPVAQFTSDVVCLGLPTTFTDQSTPVGSISAWAWDFDNNGTTDATTQNPTHVFPAAGTFPVKLTVTWGGCTSTMTANVTVNPNVSPVINPSGPHCANAAPVTLTANLAGGTWSGTGITNAAAGTFDPSVAAIGNNTISYTTTGSCGGTYTATVVVNALPVSNAGTDVTICSGAAASVGTATTAGYTYSWSPATGLSASNISNPANTTTNSGTTAVVTNYTVTTTANSCTSTDVVQVTVNPQPVLTITNPAPVCSPNTVDITAAAVTAGSTGGGTFTYWTDAGATIPVSAPAAVAASGTYYIKVTAAGGCTDIDPVVVTINPLPVSAAGPDVTICSGTAATIGSATTAGYSYSWSPVTGLTNPAISNPGITTTNSGASPVVTSYTVTTTANSCSSTDVVQVTVNPLPVLTITNPPAVCSPNTVDITAAAITAGSTGGGTFTYWTDAGGTLPVSAPTAVATSGTYYIKVTAAGGCTDIDPVVVTINSLPSSGAGPDVTICSGTAASIGLPSTAGYTYSWSPSTGLTDPAISNPGITTTNNGTSPIVTSYTVTTTSNSCTSTDVVQVTVNPLPVLTITNPATVCAPNTVDITAAAVTAGSTGGGTFTYWTDAGATTPVSAPTAIAASGTYYIKVTAAGGCTDIDPVVVTINSLPSSGAGPDVTICSGTAASIGLPATAGYSYSWSPVTGLTDPSISNPGITTSNSGTSPIVTSYTVTTTSNSCTSTDVVQVTVNPQPVLAITNPAAVCSPATIDLTAVALTAGSTGGGTFTYWTDAGATAPVAAPTAVAASGTYYIKVTAAGGCTDIDPVVITINPLPLSAAGTDVSICSGTAAGIGSATTGGYSYSWSPTTGLTDPFISNPGITTLNSSATPVVTNYTVTTSITATGCTSTDVVQVTVNPQPVLTITDPAAVCSPATVDITAAAVTAGSTGGGTFTYWTDAAATTALITPAAVAVSGTYYIKVTATGGCTDIDPVTVTINPLPVSNAGTDVMICTGTAASIGSAAVAGNSYSWSPAAGLSDPLIANPSITTVNNGAAPVVTNYTVTTTTIATGCTSTDVVQVTVNPYPVLATTDPAAVCAPNTIDLTAPAITTGTIGSGTYSYWLDAAATVALANPSAVAASGTYYIQLMSGAGCSDIDSVIVTINPLPVSNAGPDIAMCTGNSGIIGTAGTPGYNYLWSPVTGLNNPASSNPSVTLTNTTSLPVNSIYSVTTTNALTGCSSVDSVTVTTNPLATANAGSSQSVCAGTSLTLGGSVGGSATGGFWTGGAGTYVPDNMTLNAVYTPSAAEYASGSIILTLTTNDPAGCISSSNVSFFFFQNPVVNFSVNDPNGCPIHCASFTDLSTVAAGDAITSWNWDFGDGSPDSTSQNPSHCYPLTGNYDVTLTVVNNHNCSSSDTQIHAVTVYPVPVAGFTSSPDEVSVLNPEVTLVNASSADVIFWTYYFGDGDSIAPNISSPVHMYPSESPETYMATLMVENQYGCRDTIQHPVEIGPEFTFFIPNAFTPNGDGVNDYFFGQGIGIKEYDIYIFDRWGNEIYHGDDITTAQWDGKANHGSEVAQQDVYVWKVKLTDVFSKKHNYIGTVTLVK